MNNQKISKEEIATLKSIENALNSFDFPILVEVIINGHMLTTANPHWRAEALKNSKPCEEEAHVEAEEAEEHSQEKHVNAPDADVPTKSQEAVSDSN